MNKCVFYFLSFLIFISSLACIIYLYGLFINSFNQLFWATINLVLMANDFLLNVSILTIFALKMRGMIIGVDPLLSTDIEKNTNLISNTMIKHSLLFSIVMIVNQGFFGMNVWFIYIDNAYTSIWYLSLEYSV